MADHVDRIGAGAAALGLLALVASSDLPSPLPSPAFAQQGAARERLVLPPAVIPNFWDPRAYAPPTDLFLGTRTVRVVTSVDYPPLHFVGADGAPTGFAVELARAACERMRIACTIQARPFGGLLEAIEAGEADVAAAAFRITGDLRARFAVTRPYFALPARIAVPSARAGGFDPDGLAGARVGVVAGTAHEAYVETFWPEAERVAAQNLAAAQAALRAGETDYLFADGLSLALWIGGRASEGCCTFADGPFLEPRFFGEGIGFVLRPEDAALARAFDEAIRRLHEEGAYGELYLRFFPVSPL
ncbi:transporter substrate-binding domain-containing protein [Salinarimonas sp.]|uniref:transporter substrate-binding domain-containing protein n=1 Tax=Salinarimonas sp. TaxID=2766526 RepID=UPI00391D08FE